MLIFVIIREQWTDELFFELRVREAKCHPFSYYKDSIKQVVPFFERVGEPTLSKNASASRAKMSRNKLKRLHCRNNKKEDFYDLRWY